MRKCVECNINRAFDPVERTEKPEDGLCMDCRADAAYNAETKGSTKPAQLDREIAAALGGFRFYETQVSLEESPPFKAWTTGQLWNGWATPYFEKMAADRVIAELGSSSEDAGGPHRAYYDRARDAYVVQWYADPKAGTDVWNAETITTRKGKRKVYGIGAYAYTWWPKE